MIQYYGYTISPNQIETGEGFLICRNVPISRTGDQEYMGWEIGIPGAGGGQIVTVHRPPEEVFSTAALASFEGKPVTNDHPPVLIGPDDVKTYEMGHAQNVRRGDGEWEEYTLADLHIHDRELIDAVQSGKREISCGYECEYVPNGDGTYTQRNIRGNHVAVVERGRAGKRAAILDSDKVAETNKEQAAKQPERRKMKKNGLLLKLFGQAVKDKSPEEIEQMAMDTADALDAETGEPGGGEKPAGGEKTGEKEGAPGGAEDDDMIEKIVGRVMAEIAAKQETKKADPIDAAIDTLTGKKEDAGNDGEAKVVPAEGADSKDGCGSGAVDKALALGILKALRPAIAGIKDESERRAVSDALISFVSAKDGASDIEKLIQTAQNNAKSAADANPATDVEALQKLYDSRNPHMNGGKA